jgi:EmrB/QacA subfamily drug resistance transporter
MSPPAITNRPLVIVAVMASMSMVALEATIVSTAMPQIVAQLGGLRLYAWVFSAFLLTQTAMTVVFGKLADVYGRKPMVLIGIGVFLLGSVLAGFAWSMPSMIAFRLIQGVGAGAIMPVVVTIVGDLYPAHERGKIQGYLASVWAASAVVGPLAGGLIIRDLSWSWIFWLNVPIGLGAAVLFVLFLGEKVKSERRSIDIAGAALFTLAVAALMVALTETEGTDSARQWWAAGVFVVCLVLFLLQERRAVDPMISFALWRRRAVAAANAGAVVVGVVLMGLTTFLPMYVQGVLHQSPVVAGLALTMIMLGWPSGATLSVRLFPRFGLRRMTVAGSVLLPIGGCAFIFLGPGSSPVLAGIGSLVMGLGMGLVSVSSLVLIQEIVDWSQRGSATASNLFARNLGSTIGAAALGAVLNFGLSHSPGVGTITSDALRRTLEAPAGSRATAIGLALQHSLHTTFWAIFVVSLSVVAAAVLIPSITVAQGPRPSELPAE